MATNIGGEAKRYARSEKNGREYDRSGGMWRGIWSGGMWNRDGVSVSGCVDANMGGGKGEWKTDRECGVGGGVGSRSIKWHG